MSEGGSVWMPCVHGQCYPASIVNKLRAKIRKLELREFPDDEFLKVVKNVSVTTGVSVDSIVGRCKQYDVSDARFLVYCVLRHCKELRVSQIAKVVRRDHGAIIHGLKRIDERRLHEKKLRKLIYDLGRCWGYEF
tara:strand:+ start:799 stop:1203 length:405 start_codon:yes stop_codon:yes gene_type:complete